jgi:hypothetical protein
MTVNIPTHFVEQYTTNVAHLLQIQGGKLRASVSEDSHIGDAAVPVDQYGAVEMQEVTGRFQPMGRVDASLDRRWVYPVDYDLPQMVDSFDKLRLMVDPQGPLAQAAVKGAARQIDRIIFDAFFADARTGRSGGTTEAFDTANFQVAADTGAAADTGLNVDKIIEAKRIMEDANVDFELEGDPYMAITPTQHADLLRQTQVINTDYFTKMGSQPVLVDGRVTSFCGVNIIVSNLVEADATYRRVPMWVKSGMHLGTWKDVTARVDDRPDIKGVPYQLYTCLTMGATRLEQGRVVEIQCLEA